MKLVKCKICGGYQIPPDEDEPYICLNCGATLIVECEFTRDCPKSSDSCFNQYKDDCPIRSTLSFTKNLEEKSKKKDTKHIEREYVLHLVEITDGTFSINYRKGEKLMVREYASLFDCVSEDTLVTMYQVIMVDATKKLKDEKIGAIIPSDACKILHSFKGKILEVKEVGKQWKKRGNIK